MHEDTAGDAVAVYAGEGLPASLRILDYPHYQEDVQHDDCGAAYESPFLADGAEYEVCTLLGNEAVGGLGSVEVALSCKSSRTDCNHGLVHIVSDAGRVFLHSEKHLDTLSLVVLEHAVEQEVHGEYQQDACEGGDDCQMGEHIPFPEGLERHEWCGDDHQTYQDVKRFYLGNPRHLPGSIFSQSWIRRLSCSRDRFHDIRKKSEKHYQRNAYDQPPFEPSRIQADAQG